MGQRNPIPSHEPQAPTVGCRESTSTPLRLQRRTGPLKGQCLCVLLKSKQQDATCILSKFRSLRHEVSVSYEFQITATCSNYMLSQECSLQIVHGAVALGKET